MSDSKIPKKIHQIWIGDQAMPDHCLDFVRKMQYINSEYEHKLWGNEVLTELYKDDKFLKEYTKYPEIYKWAFIADRVRLLLLRDFGGIYCDVDCNPIKSFDVVLEKLNPNHTFFSGLKPTQDNDTLVDCTVYGSAPNSRIVNICLDTYKDIYWANGCRMFSDEIIKHCDNDVALFGHEYFYDNKVTDKTILLHDVVETRLFSWTDDDEVKNPKNW